MCSGVVASRNDGLDALKVEATVGPALIFAAAPPPRTSTLIAQGKGRRRSREGRRHTEKPTEPSAGRCPWRAPASHWTGRSHRRPQHGFGRRERCSALLSMGRDHILGARLSLRRRRCRGSGQAERAGRRRRPQRGHSAAKGAARSAAAVARAAARA